MFYIFYFFVFNKNNVKTPLKAFIKDKEVNILGAALYFYIIFPPIKL